MEVFNTIHVETQNDWFNEMKFSKQAFVPAIACVQNKIKIQPMTNATAVH